MTDCVYFVDGDVDNEVHCCRLLDSCVETGGGGERASCDLCKERLSLNDPEFATKWVDPLDVVDMRHHKTDSVRGLLAGRPAFLLCGGPSANELPLEYLSRRGCWTMGVNNVAGHPRVRPQAFVCADPPSKFSHSIWLDPGIMKWIPTPKMSGRRGKLLTKLGGIFQLSEQRCTSCPNVWGFRRESWLEPDDRFFLDNGAHWGNHQSGVERTGQPKTVCTMFLGFRLMRYLGCGRLYLIGVDFRMGPGKGYSFNQGRDKGACNSNNRQYGIVNKWLCEMQEKGVFERFGMPVYNCYERSGLRAFPYVPFEDAVADAQGIIEDEPDLVGWYDKQCCPECHTHHIRHGGEDCECMECGKKWNIVEQKKMDGEAKRKREELKKKKKGG